MSEQAGAGNTPNTSESDASAHWVDSLPEEFSKEKSHPKIRDYKSPGELARAYVNTLPLLAKKSIGLSPLPADATDEQREAWDVEYRKTVGVPEAPDKYSYKGTVPEGYDLNAPGHQEFRKVAHAAGITPAQYNKLVDHLFAVDGKLRAEGAAAEAKRREESEVTMRGEWGDKYEENKHQAERVLSQFGDEKFIAEVKESGLGSNPGFLRMLHKLAPSFSEASLKGDGSAPLDGNPLKTKEELQSMMAAKDDRGQRKYDTDPAYRAMLDAEYKRSYPGSYNQRKGL